MSGPSGAVLPVATAVQRPLRPCRPGGGDLPGHHRGAVPVSAARATEAGATLAVGEDVARGVVLTTLGATVLALMTVLVAVPLAVVTYRARSRTPR